MRKLIYILPIIFSYMFVACEVEEETGPNPKTAQAKEAYNGVDSRLFENISILDLMSKVDYYAQADTDKKEGIKNYYLREYALEKSSANTWTLTNEVYRIVFTHNLKSINEADAEWTAQISKRDGDRESVIIDDDNFRLNSNGDKEWKLTSVNLNYFNASAGLGYYMDDRTSTSELLIKGALAYDKSLNLYDYTLQSGSGIIKSLPQINYEITSPVVYSAYYQDIAQIGGSIHIDVAENKIDVEIGMDGLSVKLRITLNGITEEWY